MGREVLIVSSRAASNFPSEKFALLSRSVFRETLSEKIRTSLFSKAFLFPSGTCNSNKCRAREIKKYRNNLFFIHSLHFKSNIKNTINHLFCQKLFCFSLSKNRVIFYEHYFLAKMSG